MIEMIEMIETLESNRSKMIEMIERPIGLNHSIMTHPKISNRMVDNG